MITLEQTEEQLRKWREAHAEYDEAEADYAAVVAPYEERIETLESQIGEIEEAMMDDPRVIAAADRRDAAMEISHNKSWRAAEVAVRAYYDEHGGFPNGKDSCIIEGCRVYMLSSSEIVWNEKGALEERPTRIVRFSTL